MFDREVVKEFLQDRFEDIGLKVPKEISEDAIVDSFCKYVEDDYYEWLKDNLKSFFNHGNPDWDWIEGQIKSYSKD